MVKLLHRGNKEAREAIQGMANFSNYAIKWFRFIIIDFSKTLLSAPGKPVCPCPTAGGDRQACG